MIGCVGKGAAFCATTTSKDGGIKPPLTEGEDGACRRRGRRGRGGGRRVRRRSTGPRGRAGGENRRRPFLLSANCIRCNSKPGCGRNCTPTALAARRGPGT